MLQPVRFHLKGVYIRVKYSTLRKKKTLIGIFLFFSDADPVGTR